QCALPPQTPYKGTPWPIPGTVEGENYDVGGEGVSYHDTTPGNTLGQYRTGANEDVDVEKACGSNCYDISSIDPGEWVEFTVNVKTTPSYMVTLGVAAAAAKKMHIEMDGTDVSGALTVAATGSLTTFQSQPQATPIALTAGQKVMRVVFDEGAIGLNW